MTDRVKRPSYQFYPRDERADMALQACPLVARGLWHEMKNIMHSDGEPYGHLRVAGQDVTVEELARYVGEPAPKVKQWLNLLEVRQVFSRTPSGTIYSRRMVRDEHIRNVRAQCGAKGGNPALVGKPSTLSLVNHSSNLMDHPIHPLPDHPPDNMEDNQIPTPAVAVASASAAAAAAQHIFSLSTPTAATHEGAATLRSPKSLVPTEQERQVLDHYHLVHPRRGPADEKQIRKVRAALRSFTVDQLRNAIDGNAQDAWHAERRKHELTYVLRDNDTISGFLDRYAQQHEALVGDGGELTDAGRRFFGGAR